MNKPRAGCPACGARPFDLDDHCDVDGRGCGWWRCRRCDALTDGDRHAIADLDTDVALDRALTVELVAAYDRIRPEIFQEQP